MADQLAHDYAVQLADRIRTNQQDGFPFGYYHELTSEYTEERPDGLVEHESESGDLQDEDGNRVSPAGASHWIEDALDLRWTLDRDGSYRSVEVCLTFGGPTAWLDTADNTVTVWWGDKHTESIPAEWCDALDEYAAELWESIR